MTRPGITFLREPDPPSMRPRSYALDGTRPRNFRNRLGPRVYGISDVAAAFLIGSFAGMVALRIMQSLWGTP